MRILQQRIRKARTMYWPQTSTFPLEGLRQHHHSRRTRYRSATNRHADGEQDECSRTMQLRTPASPMLLLSTEPRDAQNLIRIRIRLVFHGPYEWADVNATDGTAVSIARCVHSCGQYIKSDSVSSLSSIFQFYLSRSTVDRSPFRTYHPISCAPDQHHERCY